jgi:RNA-dependent RNA polymerase
MEKAKTGYTSEKILGQLYDLVRKDNFTPEYASPFDKRILEAFDHNEDVFAKAEAIECGYDGRIRRIMAQHDIDTEFEIWSAFVMKHNLDKKYYTFAEELGTLMATVRTSFREECEREAGGRDPAYLHPFISAMYVVTARQIQQALSQLEEVDRDKSASRPISAIDPKCMPLMSFPWLFMQDLGKIACGEAHTHRTVRRVQGAQKRQTFQADRGGRQGTGQC